VQESRAGKDGIYARPIVTLPFLTISLFREDFGIDKTLLATRMQLEFAICLRYKYRKCWNVGDRDERPEISPILRLPSLPPPSRSSQRGPARSIKARGNTIDRDRKVGVSVSHGNTYEPLRKFGARGSGSELKVPRVP